jgi:hypothetical protein
MMPALNGQTLTRIVTSFAASVHGKHQHYTAHAPRAPHMVAVIGVHLVQGFGQHQSRRETPPGQVSTTVLTNVSTAGQETPVTVRKSQPWRSLA